MSRVTIQYNTVAFYTVLLSKLKSAHVNTQQNSPRAEQLWVRTCSRSLHRNHLSGGSNSYPLC